MAVSTK